ncbi:MAG: lysine--tRNA ligase [Alphaproteobacteria bacterium]
MLQTKLLTSLARTKLSDNFTELKSWPFQEARKILKRINNKTPEKGYVLFETGYGPSGLPHIGTFGEVVRTSFVRNAFDVLTEGKIPTKLFVFSDDMDGLRKVPDNVPNKELLTEYLEKPLTVVPDPFGTHDSFGAHNNNRLKGFLDTFGFDYEFKSATEYYKSGQLDETLLHILKNYDKVINVILPTLGEERRATYSPFLPVCKRTGKVLQASVIAKDIDAGTITYVDPETSEEITTPVTGGNCKLQWKADWAMRWYALGVDYEMSGKDLIESVRLSSKICRILGMTPPEGLTYELFLDAEGGKISKSKGNGLSVEEWLTYAPDESLALFMFQNPQRAKRLYFEVIPKNVDEYLQHNEKATETSYDSPAWHVNQVLKKDTTARTTILNFNMLLNLASVCNTEDKAVLWGFISQYDATVSPEKNPFLDALVGYAIRYYKDFVKPKKNYRAPTDAEKAALTELADVLAKIPTDMGAKDIQTEVFTVGKNHNYENLREWFKTLYQILLGQDEGPRMGSFIALYGLQQTIDLIKEKNNV